MSTSILHSLRSINAFQDLPAGSLDDIARHSSLREYQPEQTVITYGESSTTVYFLLSGTVRATMLTQQGREISYQDLGPGEMFGELAAIDHMPRSTSVVVRERATVLLMSGEYFLQLLARHPRLGEATLHKMAGMVRFLCDRVYNFGALDVRSRVRAELYRLAIANGRENRDYSQAIEIQNVPPQRELANQLATHREAVSREFSSLEKAGLIKKGKGTLLVLDLEALRASIES